MPQRGIEIVRGALAALNRGDIDGALSRFDPGVEVDWSRRYLDPTVRHGHQGVLETVGGIFELFAEVRLETEELTEVGEDVLYVGNAHFQGRGSGAQVAARAAVLWTVRHGKITRFRFFQSKEDALTVVEAEGTADV